jgi:hypothetical protein
MVNQTALDQIAKSNLKSQNGSFFFQNGLSNQTTDVCISYVAKKDKHVS